MALKITPQDQAGIDQIATDVDTLLRSGVQVEPATPYAIKSVPVIVNIPNQPTQTYNDIVPIGSDSQLLALDATRASLVALYRRLSPISYSNNYLTPSFILSTAALVNILTSTMPLLEVPRTVMVSFQFSCYATAVGGINYQLTVNGVQQGPTLKFTFNDAGSHRQLSGSVVATLPAGTPVIGVWLQNASVSGSVVLDSGDFINLTLIG
jgi:hypothetical protein